jgi:hypothetical protein
MKENNMKIIIIIIIMACVNNIWHIILIIIK